MTSVEFDFFYIRFTMKEQTLRFAQRMQKDQGESELLYVRFTRTEQTLRFA